MKTNTHNFPSAGIGFTRLGPAQFYQTLYFNQWNRGLNYYNPDTD